MPEYQRFYLHGGTYFFTVVTYRRYPIFSNDASVKLLQDCFNSTIEKLSFRIDALVILPDHLHTIWTLPENDSDYSTRWKLIKALFSKRYNFIPVKRLPDSRNSKGESGIWQRRFWEHHIRDNKDYERHCDYIHYNPVKHGFVKSPSEWTSSSFRDFVNNGFYDKNWGSNIDKAIISMDIE
jgi:putative transposase